MKSLMFESGALFQIGSDSWGGKGHQWDGRVLVSMLTHPFKTKGLQCKNSPMKCIVTGGLKKENRLVPALAVGIEISLGA